MMKILHLSDLHFGTERPELITCLYEQCKMLAPDIIVISGDLTQRATHSQYRAVMHFLSPFNTAILCVPGNHDISLYNPIERFFYPYAKYRKWVAMHTDSQFIKDDIAIIGINSVTPYKAMSGYVTDGQLQKVSKFFAANNVATKIVVMHHNLIAAERHRIINDADKILNAFANSGVNFVLAGHIHSSKLELLNKKYIQNKLYIITAGTATSTRTTAPNSFNFITINKNEFSFKVYDYLNGDFTNVRDEVLPLK